MDLTTAKAATTPLFNVPIAGAIQTPQVSIPEDISAMANAPTIAQPKKKHGALHNILSTLGDFLLGATGLDDIIKKRKLNEAFQGFDQDPTGTISRVSQIDYEIGSKLRDQYIDNQRLAASQAATAEEKAGRLALAQEGENQRTRGYAASMLGSMAAWNDEKRKQYYPQMRQQVLTAASRKGLDLSAEIPEEYSPEALDAFLDGAVPVGTQRSQRLTRDRNEATDALGKARLAETVSHNDVTEGQGAARIAETRRHNGVSEGTARARVAASGARTGRPKPVDRYTAEDGTRVIVMSDGTERKGTLKVRPPGKAGGTASAGTPREGMRMKAKNGAIYEWRNGKGVRVQ